MEKAVPEIIYLRQIPRYLVVREQRDLKILPVAA